MTSIKILMEKDFVSYYKIHSEVEADCISIQYEQFDLEDMPSPIQVKSFGKGEVSFTNETYGYIDVLAYENFVNQCKKPSSFLIGRKKCDYIAVHREDSGYAMLIELTSALGTVQNLAKPIDKFPGGKYEKSEVQLEKSLKDLLSVNAIKECLMSKKHRICLLSYCINPHTDPDYLRKHPFERYLKVESQTTAENGAEISNPAINALGFEYRRINHDFSFRLS